MLSTCLRWTISDAINEKLIRLEQIPNSFNDIAEWVDSLRPHVLEDLRASIEEALDCSNLHILDFSLSNQYFINDIASFDLSTGSEPILADNLDDIDDVDEDLEFAMQDATISTLVGVFSTLPLDQMGKVPRVNGQFFAKILLFISNENQKIKKKNKIWVSREFCEEMDADPKKKWNLYILPKCSTVPYERIDRGLDSCLEMQCQKAMTEILTGQPLSHFDTERTELQALVHEVPGNKNQLLSIRKIMTRMKTLPNSLPVVQLIHGPPGTGKSRTIVNTIFQLLRENIPVFASAPTNYAVCEIAKRSYKEAQNVGYPLRLISLYGSKNRLKLDESLAQIHVDSRALRLVTSIRRWGQKRLELLQYLTAETALLDSNIFKSVSDDLEIIARECPSSMINDNDREVLENILQDLSQFPHLNDFQESLLLKVKKVPLYDLISRADLSSVKNEIVASSELLFSTVSTAASLRFNRERNDFLEKFSCIVVDEASQLLEATTSILLTSSLKCIILVGDHKQLPATVRSSRSQQLGYQTSLFERLIKSNFCSTMLNIQYRMHPKISKWPAKHFYRSKLTDGSNVQGPDYSQPWHDEFPPLAVYDAEGEEEASDSKGWYNPFEVIVVVRAIRKFAGLLEKHRITKETSIAVISPYKAQVAQINAELISLRFEENIKIECSTVDAFQGKECDIVIFSAVRSNGKLGFLTDMRRFNVAITRAKYALLVIGNHETLSVHYRLADFIDYATRYDKNSDVIRFTHEVLKKQENQKRDLLKENSNLFETSRWSGKISFTNEFKMSFMKLDDERKSDIMRTLLRLANGRWPRLEQPFVRTVSPILTEIVFVIPFGSSLLVWCIDAKKIVSSFGQLSLTQIIKIIGIIDPNSANFFLSRIRDQIFTKNQALLDFLKKRTIVSQIILPTSMAIVDSSLVRPVSIERVSNLTKDCEDAKMASIEKTYSLSSNAARLLLLSKEGDNLQLPHDMSSDEMSLINEPGPHFVLGRSGTGKTTVMLYRMLRNERRFQALRKQELIDDHESFRQLLVTASPVLASAIQKSFQQLNESGKQVSLLPTADTNMDPIVSRHQRRVISLNSCRSVDFPMITTYEDLLKKIDLCLSSPFQKTLRGNSGTQITFILFRLRYYKKLGDVTDNGRFQVDAAILYKEFISVIKGSMDSIKGNGSMTREAYVALAEKKASGLNALERNHFYTLYERYESMKNQSDTKDFDSADFVYHVYSELVKCNPIELRFQAVFVDEVQDLTMLQISILRFICSEWNGYFFAGDTAQTIAQGVGFRFESLKDLTYHEFLPKFSHQVDKSTGIPQIKQLKQNFRTHNQVLLLANTVIKLILHFFPESMDKVNDELSVEIGPKPVFLQNTEDVISEMFSLGEIDGNQCEFGSEQVILVRDLETKEKVKGFCGKNALVLTVYECKGMEFSDVLIYNFFSSAHSENNNWRILYNSFQDVFNIEDNSFSCPPFDERLHFGLCQELKMLYVLITRAKQRIYFFEKEKKVREVILHLWNHDSLKVIDFKPFDERMKQILTVKSTPEEWFRRGMEFFNRQDFENALMCFQRAGNYYHERLCIAKIYETKAFTAEEEASNLDFSQNLRFQKEAEKFYCQAADIYENEPLSRFKEAATLYKKGKKFLKAGELFAKEELFLAAGSCYEEAKDWIPAGENYVKGEEVLKGIDCYYKAANFSRALEVIDEHLARSKALIEHANAKVDAKEELQELELATSTSRSRSAKAIDSQNCQSDSEEDQAQTTLDDIKEKQINLQKELPKLRTDCIKKGADLGYSKSDQKSMLHFIQMMDTVMEKRLYLSRRHLFSSLTDLELQLGNYEYVGNIYLQQGKYTEAVEILQKAITNENSIMSGSTSNIASIEQTIQRLHLKLIYMQYLDDELQFIFPNKTQRDSNTFKESLVSLLNSRFSAFQDQLHPASIDLKYEVKFWLNIYEQSDTFNLLKLQESYAKCPPTLKFRLLWQLIRKVIKRVSSSWTWLDLKRLIELFRDEVGAEIMKICSKFTSPSFVYSSTSLSQNTDHQQILDLFGLRITSSTTTLGIEHFSPNGKKNQLSNIQKFWKGLASSAESKKKKPQLKPSSEAASVESIYYKEAFGLIQSHVSMIITQDQNFLYAKAKETYEKEIFREFQSKQRFTHFRSKFNQVATFSGVPFEFALPLLKYLASPNGNLTNHQPKHTQNRINEKEIQQLLIHEVYFPIFYLFYDQNHLVQLSNFHQENQEGLADLLMNERMSWNTLRVLFSRRKYIEYDHFVLDYLLMDHLPMERVDVALEMYIQRIESMKYRNPYFRNLFYGKRYEIKYCLLSKNFPLLSEGQRLVHLDLENQLHDILNYLMPSISNITNFLKADWSDAKGPFHFQRNMISPFIFLQLMEQTIVLVQFLLNMGDSNLLISKKLLAKTILNSSNSRALYWKLSSYFREVGNHYLWKSQTKDKLEKKLMSMGSVLNDIINLEFRYIRDWFYHASVGADVGNPTRNMQNEESYQTCYMRSLHLLFFIHFNSNSKKRFGNKIRESISYQKENIQLLPELYLKYLERFRSSTFSSLTDYLEICWNLQDPMLEIRTDGFNKQQINTNSSRLDRKILHASSEQRNALELIDDDQYLLWYQHQCEVQEQLGGVTLPAPIALETKESEAAEGSPEGEEEGEGEGEEAEDELDHQGKAMKSTMTRQMRYKFIDWLARTRKRLQTLTEPQRFKRIIEKQFLSCPYHFSRRSRMVKTYQKFLFSLYFELLHEGKAQIEELSGFIDHKKSKIVTIISLDDALDILEVHYERWCNQLNPELFVQEWNEKEIQLLSEVEEPKIKEDLPLAASSPSGPVDEDYEMLKRAQQIKEQQQDQQDTPVQLEWNAIEDRFQQRREIIKEEFQRLGELLKQIKSHLSSSSSSAEASSKHQNNNQKSNKLNRK